MARKANRPEDGSDVCASVMRYLGGLTPEQLDGWLLDHGLGKTELRKMSQGDKVAKIAASMINIRLRGGVEGPMVAHRLYYAFTTADATIRQMCENPKKDHPVPAYLQAKYREYVTNPPNAPNPEPVLHRSTELTALPVTGGMPKGFPSGLSARDIIARREELIRTALVLLREPGCWKTARKTWSNFKVRSNSHG